MGVWLMQSIAPWPVMEHNGSMSSLTSQRTTGSDSGLSALSTNLHSMYIDSYVCIYMYMNAQLTTIYTGYIIIHAVLVAAYLRKREHNIIIYTENPLRVMYIKSA